MIIRILATFALLVAPVSIAAQSPAVDAAREAMGNYDREEGRVILTEACEAGDAAACQVLMGYLAGRFSDEEQAEGFTLSQRLCDNGDLLACINFADLVDRRSNDGVDQTLALDSLAKACRGGFYTACPGAAEMADRGESVTQDQALALTLADTGCQGGHAISCEISGNYLRQAGWDTQDDDVLQQSWDAARAAYRRGCELGNVQSCYGLARFLLDGHMGDIDRDGGRALLKTACETDISMCDQYIRALTP